ncbi:Cthe_2314 family HEPN domain-containing protein [Anaerosinus massiliensis]|uniref:Cthe_2314 family HEPN domain-containing protein n=1 Tax=Massilibacillus massiliensis TaxID=1806837 RepID=UPI000DA63F81|nr:Cthe_2314 family HEPN domain-containing protein [Massilibacillus massiliensis]
MEYGYPKFPTDEAFSEIAVKIFPLQSFKQVISEIRSNKKVDIWGCFLNGKDAVDWTIILSNKISQIQLSYPCAYHYAEKFNDDVWHRNNEEEGCIEYFPYTQKEALNKAMFDFFAYTCFSVVFSAFDIIGQVVNGEYKLGFAITDVSFNKIVCPKLENINKNLFDTLNKIKKGDKFESVKLRHSFIHRIPPTELIAFAVKDKGNVKSLTVGKYVTSKEIMECMKEAIDCLLETLNAIKN